MKDPAMKDPATKDPAMKDPAMKDPAMNGRSKGEAPTGLRPEEKESVLIFRPQGGWRLRR